MRRIEWLLLSIVAILGIAAVLSDAARFEPLSRYGIIPSAAFYENAAVVSAADYGLDVTDWARVSTTSRNGELRLAWEQDLVAKEWRLLSPYSVTVRFYGPNQELCRVVLDYRGNPVGFFLGSRTDEDRPTATTTARSADEIQRAREIAVLAFSTRWRPASPLSSAVDFGFHLTADAVAEGRDLEFEWTSNADPAGMVAWRVDVSVRDGAINRFRLEPLILEPLRERERSADNTMESALFALIVLAILGVVVAFVLTILNLARRRLPWGFFARVTVMVGAFLTLNLIFGDDLRNRAPDWFQDPNAVMQVISSLMLNTAIAVALICAGRSTRTASDFRRWLGIEDLLRLNWAKASVARGFWTASPIALLWISLPYLVSRPFSGVLLESPTRRALGLPVPFVEAMAALPTLGVLFVLAFSFPIIKAFVAQRPLRAALAVVVGAIGATTISPVNQPMEALAASALAYGVLMAYTYTRFGVLASVLGGILALPLSRAFALSVAGDGTMQSWGFGFLVCTALVTTVAAVLDMRNPAREEEQYLSAEEMAAYQHESSRGVVSKREQLLGEFALAQQAQQRMLPARPPYIEGFEIASICRPAQQVGGDLYDYIQLQDSRWACCVADVSGKGVSAALYMTMIKGLLNALRLERANLMEIATVMNDRVYEVMRRRSFVTMSLAAIDPQTRSLELIRAGHLPMLHVASEGEVRFVESKGMGLGLAGSALFCRNLDSASCPMRNGDVAVLYSDGVTEAMNPAREEFGEERFAATVAALKTRSALEIRDGVMEAIQQFQCGAPVHDDITVMVLKAVDKNGKA